MEPIAKVEMPAMYNDTIPLLFRGFNNTMADAKFGNSYECLWLGIVSKMQ